MLGIIVDGNASPLKRQNAIRYRLLSPRKHLDATPPPGAYRDRPIIKPEEADLTDIEVHRHFVCIKDKPLSLRHRFARTIKAQSS